MTRRRDLGDSDLQGLDATYRAICAERHWEEIIEEADPPHSRWLDVAVATTVATAAIGACWLLYFWVWGWS